MLVDLLVRSRDDRGGRHGDDVDGLEQRYYLVPYYTAKSLRLYVIGTGEVGAQTDRAARVREEFVPPIRQVVTVVGQRFAQRRHDRGRHQLLVVRQLDVD